MRPSLFVVLMLAGCLSGPAKAVQASTCEKQGEAIIQSASDCPTVVMELQRLVIRSPECAAVFSDEGGAGVAGVHCKDGGAP